MEAVLTTTLTMSAAEVETAIWTYLKGRGVAVPESPAHMTVKQGDMMVDDVEVTFGTNEKIDLLAK